MLNRLKADIRATIPGLRGVIGDRTESNLHREEGPDEISTDQLPPEPLPQTTRLASRSTSIEDLVGQPRPYAPGSGEFRVVPANPRGIGRQPVATRWRIELRADDPHLEPLRLEIAGDAILGRANWVDVNLLDYGAVEHGVSRRHAMLRPSNHALYLIDLGSSNGTQCNGIPVGTLVAVPLALHSVIRLGKLLLTVRYLSPVR